MFEITKITPSPTIDSREVAERLGKSHSDLLKDIRKFEEYLAEGNFPLCQYFLKSEYIDGNDRVRPCYQITRKGCEFLTHKMTGKSGAIFTAFYIERFNEMSEELTHSTLPQNILMELVESQKRFMEQATQLIKQSTEPRALPAVRKRKSQNVRPLLLETFPQEIQEVVLVLNENGYSIGRIVAMLKPMGYSISENAVRKFIKRGGGN